jgi:pimeloyl-ACP methyl ester carboxylesterase
MILNTIDQGSGPPVVLLHGLFGTARNLGVIARGLSRHARVLSMDLRNHGDSPHDPRMDYPTMAADISETMASLGVPKAAVAGHSMGGKVAMMLALTRPAVVEKLIVMDIAPVAYGRHGYAAYVEAMKRIPLTNEINRKAASEMLAPAIPESSMRLFLLSNLVLGENPHWRFGLEEIGGAMPNLVKWHLPPDAAPYPGPALFLRGGNSDYVPPEAEAPIRELFPNARIETIPNAAHWLHAEQPKVVLAALEVFLL